MSQPPPEHLGALPPLELHFYPITDRPTPRGQRARFAAWLDATRGKVGAYVIRFKGDPPNVVRYVGSSRKRNYRGHGYLRTVILRHVHGWRGPTAGIVYHRDEIEVAVIICRTGEIAGWAERELTRRLGPVDNTYNKQTSFQEIEPSPDEEAADEIPF
jgi:hypothetical protein